MYKLAKHNNRELADSVLRQIYSENPEYWPDGLYREGMDDLYLIKDANTEDVAGFVGWQEFPKKRDGKLIKVGYYVIGVLPEHRQKGFAKEAVAKLINKKAQNVDKVEASIVETNKASLGLADTLCVDKELWKAAAINSSSNSSIQNAVNNLKQLQKDTQKNIENSQKEQQRVQEQQQQQQQDRAKFLEDQKSKIGDQFYKSTADNIPNGIKVINTAENVKNNISMNSDNIFQKQAGMGNFLKKILSNEIFQTGAGAAAGTAISDQILNPHIFQDDTTPLATANTLSNMIVGGVLGNKSLGKSFKAKTLTGASLKEPALSLGEQVTNSFDDTTGSFGKLTSAVEPSATKLESAAENLEEASATAKEQQGELSKNQKYLLGTLGVLGAGAGAIALYDRILGNKSPTGNYSEKNRLDNNSMKLEIPAAKINPDFYKRMSREILFDTPKQKKEHAQELMNDYIEDQKQLEEEAKKEQKQASLWDMISSSAMPLLRGQYPKILGQNYNNPQRIYQKSQKGLRTQYENTRANPALMNYIRENKGPSSYINRTQSKNMFKNKSKSYNPSMVDNLQQLGKALSA